MKMEIDHAREKLMEGVLKASYENAPKAATSLMDKIPGGALTAIGLPSLAAGAYTAAQPPEELGGELDTEYDTKKADFDRENDIIELFENVKIFR